MCNVCAATDALDNEHGRETDGYGLRAQGQAEFAPATYQIRRIGQPWPAHWADTTDLAGTVGALGFDSRNPNSKVRSLRVAITKALRRGRLAAIYPRLELCHRRMIWEDFWTHPIRYVWRLWTTWRNAPPTCNAVPADVGPDKVVAG